MATNRRTASGALGRILDAAIGVVSPSRQALRAAYRSAYETINRTSYRAASIGRAMGGWIPWTESADSSLLPELPRMRERSRDLARNNAVANAVIETTISNEIREGIRPYAAVDWRDIPRMTEKQATKLNRQIDRRFATWARTAEFTGRLNFYQLQELVRRLLLVDGEAFLVRRTKPRLGSRYLFSWDVVEADRIDTPTSIVRGTNPTATGAEIRSGVELDPDGRPIAYWIARGHPGDLQLAGQTNRHNDPRVYERVEAFDSEGRPNVLHIYKVKRPGQTRGEPFFAPVMHFFQHLDDFMEAELMAARVAACFAIFIKKKGDPITTAAMNATSSNTYPQASSGTPEQRREKLAPGIIEYLKADEEMDSFNPTRPGEAFKNFDEIVVRHICGGLGLPPEVVMNSYGGMNYSAMRGAIVQASQLWKRENAFMVDELCCPTYELVIEELILREELSVPLSTFDKHGPDFCAVNWVPPGREAVDQLKDAQAVTEGRMNGSRTITGALAAQGKTLRSHVEEMRSERAVFAEAGVPFPGELEATDAEGGGAGNNPPEGPPDTPEEEAASEELEDSGELDTSAHYAMPVLNSGGRGNV